MFALVRNYCDNSSGCIVISKSKETLQALKDTIFDEIKLVSEMAQCLDSVRSTFYIDQRKLRQKFIIKTEQNDVFCAPKKLTLQFREEYAQMRNSLADASYSILVEKYGNDIVDKRFSREANVVVIKCHFDLKVLNDLNITEHWDLQDISFDIEEVLEI